MGYDDTFCQESNLSSLKETINNLEYVNNLLQVSMGGPSINWKTLDILGVDQKETNPETIDLPCNGSFVIHVLHGAYNMRQSVTYLELEKLLKDYAMAFLRSLLQGALII